MEYSFKYSDNDVLLLRPSPYALTAIERALNTGIYSVVNACVNGTLMTEQMAIIIEAGYRAELQYNNQPVGMCPTRKQLTESVYNQGVLNVIAETITPYLIALTNGGVSGDNAAGEPDAEKK